MRLTNSRLRLSLLTLVSSLPLVVGCGGGAGDQPDIGRVTGTVKLDGTPLPDAEVRFQPKDGRPSTGTTDASGAYELKYTSSVDGAKVGTHSVQISTRNTGTEKVPDVYNSKTELEREVEPGSQTIDFDDLDSKKGTIVQPPPEATSGC